MKRGAYDLAIVKVLGSQTSLPKTTIEVLETLLRDKEGACASVVAEALGNQTRPTRQTTISRRSKRSFRTKRVRTICRRQSLPKPDEPTGDNHRGAHTRLLRDGERNVQFAAAKVALGNQTSLPKTAIEALETLLRDGRWYVRSGAAEVLRNQFNRMVESIGFVDPERPATVTTTTLSVYSHEFLGLLYRILLWRSLQEQLSWSFVPDNDGGDYYVLHMPDGTQKAVL